MISIRISLWTIFELFFCGYWTFISDTHIHSCVSHSILFMFDELMIFWISKREREREEDPCKGLRENVTKWMKTLSRPDENIHSSSMLLLEKWNRATVELLSVVKIWKIGGEIDKTMKKISFASTNYISFISRLQLDSSFIITNKNVYVNIESLVNR